MNFPYLLRDDTDPFPQYHRETEPDRKTKAYAWETGIGLQAVDQLKTSDYLLQIAKKNIDDEISMAEAKDLISQYHKEHSEHLPERTQEADEVASRIAEILSENAFVFSPAQYLSIHGRLFHHILPDAGQMRTFNITKEEWILNNRSVVYGSATELRATLEYDFQMEREFSYTGLTMSQIIAHLARFISRLWQIHVFSEGNTRTTAVFLIKYLRYLGFQATNDIFAKNAWYFRNALVRANYTDISRHIREDTTYLEMFLHNLLLGENYELRNRTLHVDWPEQDQINLSGSSQPHLQSSQTHSALEQILKKTSITSRTAQNILTASRKFGMTLIFGRQDLMRQLNITERSASTLIQKMRELQIIEKVVGAGKGKYHFIVTEPDRTT